MSASPQTQPVAVTELVVSLASPTAPTSPSRLIVTTEGADSAAFSPSTPTIKPLVSPPSTPSPRRYCGSSLKRLVLHSLELGGLSLVATLVLLVVCLSLPSFAVVHLSVPAYSSYTGDIEFHIGAFMVCSPSSYYGCQFPQAGSLSDACSILNLNDPPYTDVQLPDCGRFGAFRYALLVALAMCSIGVLTLLAWRCGCCRKLMERGGWGRREQVGVYVAVTLCVAMGIACLAVVVSLSAFSEWTVHNSEAVSERGQCFRMLIASLPLSALASGCFGLHAKLR